MALRTVLGAVRPAHGSDVNKRERGGSNQREGVNQGPVPVPKTNSRGAVSYESRESREILSQHTIDHVACLLRLMVDKYINNNI